MTYGPEKFDGNVKPYLEFKSFPATATQVLVVNNGLTKMFLDDVNHGYGFNANLVCFIVLDSAGNTGCKYFD